MLRNIGYNFTASAWFFVLTLSTTPFLVHRFGSQVFGLYALLGTIAGYVAVLDLGLGVATIRFVAEHRGRREDETVGKLIGTAMAAYLGLGVLGACVLAAGGSFLVNHVLQVPPDLHHTAWVAVMVTAAGTLVTIPLSILTAVPTALQRMDITNRRNILFGTVTVAGTVALLALGRGLVAVLAFSVAVDVVAAVSFTVTVRRLLPGVSLRPRVDRLSLRRLGGFGALKFANQVATQTVYHLDKLVVAAFAPLAAVASYVISLTLAQRVASIVGNVSSAFLPAASELQGRTEGERFRELYLRASKLVALIVFPLGAVLVVFAEPVLLSWVGGDVARRSVGLLQLLAVAYTINALSTMPAVACDSRGRPGVTTAFSVASAVVNVVLALLLIPHFGAMGAAVAVLVNSLVLVPWFLAYVHRRVLRSSLGGLLRQSLLRPAAATTLILLPAWLLSRWAHGVPSLLLALTATGALYLLATIAVGTCDATDRAVFTLPLGRRRAPEPTAVV